MTAYVEIDIGHGLTTLVDEDDFDFVRQYRWRPTSGKTHVQTTIRKRVYSMHRLILRARPGEEVDHINRNGLDNRKANLRFCTKAQNNSNRRSEVNKTGFRGVTCQKGRFFAMIRANNETFIGPRRSTAIEAAADYDALALRHHGEFALINFPKRDGGRQPGVSHQPAVSSLGAQ